MSTGNFDYKEARRYCMGYGLKIALCWSATFLCTMYGPRVLLLGDIGLLIGLFSVYYAGRLIRDYNRQSDNISFLRTWWMAFLTYIFASLCTTVVQYVYFRYLDGGMFLDQMEQAMQIPAYKQMFSSVSEAEMEQVVSVLSSPSQLTYRMFMLNITLGLVLSVPTMLIARLGLNKDKNM